MRILTTLVAALCFALPALAADVTIVVTSMPLTTGTPTGCKLYLDNTALNGGVAKPCATAANPQTFTATGVADGAHTVSYTLVNPLATPSETARSPTAPLNVNTTPPLGNPTTAPSFTATCAPQPCTVTMTPIAP
jgi:hypothetical protein